MRSDRIESTGGGVGRALGGVRGASGRASVKPVRTVVGSNKDVRTNKAINKTLEKALGTRTISQGKTKAINRVNSELSKRGIKPTSELTKGSNKTLGKQARMRRGEVTTKKK